MSDGLHPLQQLAEDWAAGCPSCIGPYWCEYHQGASDAMDVAVERGETL